MLSRHFSKDVKNPSSVVLLNRSGTSNRKNGLKNLKTFIEVKVNNNKTRKNEY